MWSINELRVVTISAGGNTERGKSDNFWLAYTKVWEVEDKKAEKRVQIDPNTNRPQVVIKKGDPVWIKEAKKTDARVLFGDDIDV